MKKMRAVLPRVGTEFRIDGSIYVVVNTDENRFSAAPKEAGKLEIKPASIFYPEDWEDEYYDGRQLLDPEPEEWGWRNVKQRVV
jgi:hypothetical protein